MNKLKTKLTNLPPTLKFLVRLIYPILLYTLMHLFIIRYFVESTRIFQALFLFIWGALEWYLFLSNKKRSED